MRLKPEYKAFLDGYKPAILLGSDSEFISDLEDYPSVLIDRIRYTSCLFFQTEEAKAAYLREIVNIQQDSYEDHYLLGITLGLPKKSVDFFAQMRVNQKQTDKSVDENKEYAIGLIWAGFSFSTHLQDVPTEVTWLWETYQHPKSVEHPLYLCPEGNEMLEVPYGDQKRLAEVYQQICQKRGKI